MDEPPRDPPPQPEPTEPAAPVTPVPEPAPEPAGWIPPAPAPDPRPKGGSRPPTASRAGSSSGSRPAIAVAVAGALVFTIFIGSQRRPTTRPLRTTTGVGWWKCRSSRHATATSSRPSEAYRARPAAGGRPRLGALPTTELLRYWQLSKADARARRRQRTARPGHAPDDQGRNRRGRAGRRRLESRRVPRDARDHLHRPRGRAEGHARPAAHHPNADVQAASVALAARWARYGGRARRTTLRTPPPRTRRSASGARIRRRRPRPRGTAPGDIPALHGCAGPVVRDRKELLAKKSLRW